MNIEVEIKIAIDNFEEIKAKVAGVGKLIKSINQIDDYYIPVHKDFFAQKPVSTEWLRVRTNPDKVVFEYTRSVGMKPDGDYDYAEEYETGISDPETFKKILDFLDFKKVITVDKQREYWDCGDLEVVIDKVKDLGSFIEVEAKGNFKDATKAKQACFAFAKKLGIVDPENLQIKNGYPMLLMEKIRKTN